MFSIIKAPYRKQTISQKATSKSESDTRNEKTGNKKNTLS